MVTKRLYALANLNQLLWLICLIWLFLTILLWDAVLLHMFVKSASYFSSTHLKCCINLQTHADWGWVPFGKLLIWLIWLFCLILHIHDDVKNVCKICQLVLANVFLMKQLHFRVSESLNVLANLNQLLWLFCLIWLFLTILLQDADKIGQLVLANVFLT